MTVIPIEYEWTRPQESRIWKPRRDEWRGPRKLERADVAEDKTKVKNRQPSNLKVKRKQPSNLSLDMHHTPLAYTRRRGDTLLSLELQDSKYAPGGNRTHTPHSTLMLFGYSMWRSTVDLRGHDRSRIEDLRYTDPELGAKQVDPNSPRVPSKSQRRAGYPKSKSKSKSKSRESRDPKPCLPQFGISAYAHGGRDQNTITRLTTHTKSGAPPPPTFVDFAFLEVV
ncbi:hypothetical protein B0H13DRAFT_2290944 [Mycena leptocephala]|nr:hypothetical protein B0H13DRAFT_2290944 [Mycena leptocephala]